MANTRESAYSEIILHIFKAHYKKGMNDFEFEREELINTAHELNVKLPKNIGDIVYSFRYRKELPEFIKKSAKKNFEWIIESAGAARYRFIQTEANSNRIGPNPNLAHIKIPNSTPEIIGKYALSDEQALLAKVRYNRLVDLFLGVTAYSLQSHLRTQVKGMGQIEIDELYIALSRSGAQYVIPVQAKGGTDKLGATQSKQDLACCAEKFPDLICRAVSAQFMSEDKIAMFEVAVIDGKVQIIQEKHYKLVPATNITQEDLELYARTID